MQAHFNDAQVGTPRWQQAQAYEQAYWQRLGEHIESGAGDQLGWYRWRADTLDTWLASVPGCDRRDGKVLEIGSGPIGIVNFLNWGERFAIDPLEHFYRTNPSLVALRGRGATYIDGQGERLPFEDGSFSLVMIDNVIDHTSDPRQVLREIHRVLRPDGRLYLSVNVHTTWGALLHTALAVLRIDKGHPYTFTSRSLRRFLSTHGFDTRSEQLDSYHRVRGVNRQSASLTDQIKGYTGLSEFTHQVICARRRAVAV